VIGPERSVITSAAGLIRSLEGACTAAQITMSRAELRAAVSGGTARLTAILQTIAGDAAVQTSDAEVKQKMPALVLPIEQGEELFQAETQNEARSFLARFVTFSAETNRRSSSFLRSAPTTTLLQLAKELEGLRQETLSLPAMPKGSYSEVIKRPALRLDGTSRALARRVSRPARTYAAFPRHPWTARTPAADRPPQHCVPARGICVGISRPATSKGTGMK
jgi:hypothetical protein